MLQACLNGGRTGAEAPGVPVTPKDLARDALAVRKAGAQELHVHPRNLAGAETLAPADVAACLTAIRAAVPGMKVGLGTGAWIGPGGRQRHAHMRAWEVLPDYVSVNLNEADCVEVMKLMHERDIGIEAGVWSLADARRLCREVNKSDLLRVLIEMRDVPGPEARAEAMHCITYLRDRGVTAPILLHGQERSAWPCVIEAARLGLDTRMGFEDVLDLPGGMPAPSNAALVACARDLIDHTLRDVGP
ncbi:MAG: hypothetical protein EP307_13590 [Rhodobacteraceae bacterium]|nr:MAG: hypothetical protein EP307_13590 [Paracoccaceae bacterium]